MTAFFQREKATDNTYEFLQKRISELTSNTVYTLSLLHYDSKIFGNVIVELVFGDTVVRFIYDRGDVYRDQKLLGTNEWLNQELVFSHTQKPTEKYDLLLKAIEDFVKT